VALGRVGVAVPAAGKRLGREVAGEAQCRSGRKRL